MASNKKPSKSYQKGKVIAGANMPIPVSKRREVATKALMAVQALRDEFYSTQIGLELILFLTGCRKFLSGNKEAEAFLAESFRILNKVKDTHSATGKWSILSSDLAQLSAVVSSCVELYESMTRGQATEATMYAEKILCERLSAV